MPYYRRRRKRTYRKKRKGLKISRHVTPVTKIVKLRYATNFLLDAGTGTIDSHIFRANSIFDPDYTGTGHQPLGHDQWSVFYQQYSVVKSKITVHAASFGNTSAANGILSIKTIADDAAPGTTYNTTVLENPSTSWKVYGGNASSGPITVTKTFNHKTTYKRPISDDTFISNFGYNPNEQTYFHVCNQALADTNDSAPLECVAIIEYYVMLRTPIELNQS